MRAIGMAAVAAAFMTLAGCEQLGIGGKAPSNGSADASGVETNQAGRKPGAGEGGEAAAGDGTGLGGKDQAGVIQAGSSLNTGGAATVDRTYLLGRWTDTGNCENAVDFGPDGRFVAFDGTVGEWNVSGDRLILTGERSLTLQIVPVDQNRITVINPDGSQGQSTRC